MNVKELRAKLAALPPEADELPVLRSDIDWGGITASEVRIADFRQSTDLGAGRFAHWEMTGFTPDEDDIVVRAVIIS